MNFDLYPEKSPSIADTGYKVFSIDLMFKYEQI